MSAELIASDPLRRDLSSDLLATVMEPSPGSEDNKLKGLRILLIEDDPDTQEFVAAVLKGNGAEIIALDRSAGALIEVDRAKPDLIISDIGLAQENGYEFIQKVRRLDAESGGRIPAIALTAYAGSSDRRRALLAGFQTHLPKPVDPDDLLAAVLSLTFKPPPRS
jgi:CheY-like chemotaxis protein